MTSGAHRGYSTFSWSPAVRALCMLLVRGASVAKSSQSSPTAYIEGSHGSPASSLDFAISKQPNWVFDLFGCDERGNAYIRRLFVRTNPERKRPGPVRIALNNYFLPPPCISVTVDGGELCSEKVLASLASTIESRWLGDKQITPHSPSVITRHRVPELRPAPEALPSHPQRKKAQTNKTQGTREERPPRGLRQNRDGREQQKALPRSTGQLA